VKQNLRNALKKIRNGLEPSDILKWEETISSVFLEKFNSANIYGAYYPIQGEVSTLTIIFKLFCLGKSVALPAINVTDMNFFKIKSLSDLSPGRFALEPSQIVEPIIPEIIITPLLGYNAKGHRIGYGLGFYDKYFAQNKNVIKVGLAYAAQKVDEVFEEPFDQPLDYIITEKGLISCRAADEN
jgi:5-formyltetrahydrofolate cyclo-ligase